MDKPADLDVATVMSMGFPAYRGGLIFWADLVGAKYITDKLNKLAQQVCVWGGIGRCVGGCSMCVCVCVCLCVCVCVCVCVCGGQ